jgi:hypothetical protein
MDRFDQEGRRSGLCSSRGQPSQLSFNFLFAFTHLSQLTGEIRKRTLKVVSKLIQDVINGLVLQDLILQLIQQPSFDPISSHRHSIRAGPTIDIDPIQRAVCGTWGVETRSPSFHGLIELVTSSMPWKFQKPTRTIFSSKAETLVV